ncbi:unnamed protein product, partial [Sphacelaria rigidula]
VADTTTASHTGNPDDVSPKWDPGRRSHSFHERSKQQLKSATARAAGEHIARTRRDNSFVIVLQLHGVGQHLNGGNIRT